MTSKYVNNHQNTQVLTIKQLLKCTNTTSREAADQSDKVQKIHARFVGLGVGQRQEGGQLEAHCVSCITSLQHRKTNETHTHTKTFKQQVKHVLRNQKYNNKITHFAEKPPLRLVTTLYIVQLGSSVQRELSLRSQEMINERGKKKSSATLSGFSEHGII